MLEILNKVQLNFYLIFNDLKILIFLSCLLGGTLYFALPRSTYYKLFIIYCKYLGTTTLALRVYIIIWGNSKLNFPCLRQGGWFDISLKLSTNINNEEGTANATSTNDFMEFYRESTNFESTDPNRTNFPRLINSCIDSFEYYSVERLNLKINIDNCDLSILSVNVRGIATNFDNLITWLNTLNITFDAIILTECHIQETILGKKAFDKMYPMNGYKKYFTLSSIKYGGVVIYIKSNFEVTEVPICSQSNDNSDSLFLKINKTGNSTGNGKPLVLAGIYRHCKKKSLDTMIFINHFDELLSKIRTDKNKIIVGGDFNIDLIKATSNNDCLCFLNTILMNELENHIFKPTRIQYYKNSLQVRSATLIDIIASNLHENECQSGNLEYPDSDHFATFTVFKKLFISSNELPEKVDVYKRKIDTVDSNSLIQDFNNYDWNNLVYDVLDVDTAVDNLVNSLEELLDIHAPLTKIPTRKVKYCFKPWIDKELQDLIHTKNRLFNEKKSIPLETNRVKFN